MEEAAEAMEKLLEARLAELPEAEREKVKERLAEARKKMNSGGYGFENSRSGEGPSGGFRGGMPFPRPPGGGSPDGSTGGSSAGTGGIADMVGLPGLTGLPGVENLLGAAEENGAERKPLWFVDDQGELSVLLITAGTSDGLNTEIIQPAYLEGSDLEGKEIILRVKVES
jgi:hypothetical protein